MSSSLARITLPALCCRALPNGADTDATLPSLFRRAISKRTLDGCSEPNKTTLLVTRPACRLIPAVTDGTSPSTKPDSILVGSKPAGRLRLTIYSVSFSGGRGGLTGLSGSNGFSGNSVRGETLHPLLRGTSLTRFAIFLVGEARIATKYRGAPIDPRWSSGPRRVKCCSRLGPNKLNANSIKMLSLPIATNLKKLG